MGDDGGYVREVLHETASRFLQRWNQPARFVLDPPTRIPDWLEAVIVAQLDVHGIPPGAVIRHHFPVVTTGHDEAVGAVHIVVFRIAL